MHDTSPEMEALYHDMLMKLSGEQRLIRGARSFDAARAMILASFPPGLSRAETLRRLYQRVYGEPLPTDFPLPSD
jgi:hypothetical protein